MEENRNEYISEQETEAIKELFQKALKSYKEKAPDMTDEEWLEQLFKSEIPGMSEEERKQDAKDITDSIHTYDENLESCDHAAGSGISKERWLSEKLQEASVGMSVNEFGRTLQQMDDVLTLKNAELADALSRSSDGHIMMSPNLDGNIAENMIAKTAELSASLQGKNISVEVLESHAANSVDVRAINHETGQYQNYQLKFGKDAKATIDLLERGNYNNQRVVVPSEQLEEVQAYFKEKGSSKTITDHIDAWGVEGKSFTKEEMKKLQEEAQRENMPPELDYSHYQTKELAMHIGKNAGAMALQAAAVTTGLNIAAKLFKGEEIDGDELIENALKTGADTSIKNITAGTLEIAVRKGIIRFIPNSTPAGVIANVACVGVENAKILYKIAKRELSVTKGLDQMGRVSFSMAGGLLGMAKGVTAGAGLAGCIPVAGAGLAGCIPVVVVFPGLAVITGFIGGMAGYMCGSNLGNSLYDAGKKLAASARTVGKAALSGIKAAGNTLSSKLKKAKRNIAAAVFGF